jgi:hypothetical protein
VRGAEREAAQPTMFTINRAAAATRMRVSQFAFMAPILLQQRRGVKTYTGQVW